jgi:hypothetical protein
MARNFDDKSKEYTGLLAGFGDDDSGEFSEDSSLEDDLLRPKSQTDEHEKRTNNAHSTSKYLDNKVTKIKSFALHDVGTTGYEDFINEFEMEITSIEKSLEVDCSISLDLSFLGDDGGPYSCTNITSIHKVVVDEFDKIISMLDEDIIYLSRRYGIPYRHGRGGLKRDLEEFKNNDYTLSPKFLDLILFLLDVLRAENKHGSFLTVSWLEYSVNILNAKELVRISKQKLAEISDSGQIMQIFLDLGRMRQALESSILFASSQAEGIMKRRFAAEVSRGGEGKFNRPEYLDSIVVPYSKQAWEYGCKLLHTQMAIIFLGVLKKWKATIQPIIDELRSIAPNNMTHGMAGVKRTVNCCPCNFYEQCPLGIIIHKQSLAFDLSETHTNKQQFDIDRLIYKTREEVITAQLEKKSK